jgi:2-dehydro-3-deoxyphosphogluconate aldolase / (4S)-4-hydroxy-2-oxoglutarate aldolase
MLQLLRQHPVVPVFYHADLNTCIQVLRAAYNAGIRLFEFTNRGSNALHLFKEMATVAAKDYPEMLLGAGTIKTENTAKEFIEAGAKFIVSPFGSAEIADVCYYDKIPYLPGCMTLKEIAEATNGWGCEVVKIFPGEVLGTAFIKALKGPMPEVNVMVTGGVSIKNIKQWFDAGVTAVGMGSQLFDKTLLEQKKFDVIEKNIGQLIIAIQQ